MKLLNAATGFALGVWAYLLLGRGRFWQVRRSPSKRCASQEPQTVPRVVAVVPARNEAEVVGECVTSLLQQRGVELRIVLVDDGSTDNTAEIARQSANAQFARESSAFVPEKTASDRLTILRGRPLPSGWSGKLWAVAQGVEQAAATLRSPEAAKSAPEFLFLTDADIRHSPDSLSKLAEIARHEDADLASYMVKLSCRTVPERLLIPAFVFFFFMLYPPEWIAEPRHRTAGAAGGSILIRPDTLEKAGGIEAIRSEIIDDCALARAVKRAGGRVWLGVTDLSESLREYRTFGEIGRMIARTAFNQLDHSAALLTLSIAGLALTYILPVAAVFSGDRVAAVLGGTAWLAMSFAYLPMVRFYRLNPAWALTLPAAAVFYMGSTIFSALQFWSGRGGQWKGRAQDAKSRSQLTVRGSQGFPEQLSGQVSDLEKLTSEPKTEN